MHTPDTPSTASEPSVVPCNFRASGRLSNESTRHLRATHEAFARALSHALDLFLGTTVDVKLAGVDQIDTRAFLTSVASTGYFVPFAISSMQDRVLARISPPLIFPLLDLLLGGPGEPDDQPRELTEIDDELLNSVSELISTQLQRVWRSCGITLTPNASLKPALLSQVLSLDERITILSFEVTLASVSSTFELLLPVAFTNALVRASQSEATQRAPQNAPQRLSFRDRLFHCKLLASTELSGLRLSVGDLINVKPGDVLNLHASVATPLKLRIADRDLFEVTAVRHKKQKAAQLRTACR